MARKSESQIDEEKRKAEGFYSEAESDDNALAVSDEAYVGADPIYRNYGDPGYKPFASEDEDEAAVEKQFVEWEQSKNTTAANAPNPGEKDEEAEEAEEPKASEKPKSAAKSDAASSDAPLT